MSQFLLFNGINLEGWEVKCDPGDKDKGFWTVDNGTILCNSMHSTDHNYIWLQSTGEFAGFKLRLKFRVSRLQEGNSGVQCRSRYDELAVVEEGTSLCSSINTPGISSGLRTLSSEKLNELCDFRQRCKHCHLKS